MNDTTIDPLFTIRCTLQKNSLKPPSYIKLRTYEQRRIWAEMQHVYIILGWLMRDRILPHLELKKLADAATKCYLEIATTNCKLSLLACIELDKAIAKYQKQAMDLELYRVVANYQKFTTLLN
ncbi:MAG: hypothetical protein BGO69_15795 [Bacteroidetes bacterium 46-16]|nr:MAG: hypothetical protein BGO69_15795 [Bacteroidetes bacterium 46-16]